MRSSILLSARHGSNVRYRVQSPMPYRLATRRKSCPVSPGPRGAVSATRPPLISWGWRALGRARDRPPSGVPPAGRRGISLRLRPASHLRAPAPFGRMPKASLGILDNLGAAGVEPAFPPLCDGVCSLATRASARPFCLKLRALGAGGLARPRLIASLQAFVVYFIGKLFCVFHSFPLAAIMRSA